MPAHNIGSMTRRILKLWDAASAADLAEGLAWFNASREFIHGLAAGTIYTERQIAGMVAALSPRVSWENNTRAACLMVAEHSAGRAQPIVAGLPMNRNRAWDILNGIEPELVLGGTKVKSFYRALSGDIDAVTVDVWAQRAAEGQHYQPHAPTPQQYERIAEAYRRAAEQRGVTPRDMQAAIWTIVRRNYKEQ